MKTSNLFVCLGVLAWAILSQPGEARDPEMPVIRWPALAGINYPAEPEVLLKTIRNYYDLADVPAVPSRLIAVAASAAPYGLAGKVTAHAFKSLQPGQYERVIILAPGHGTSFENCSVPAVDVFITPLGPVPLDAAGVRHVLYSPLFSAHQLHYQGKGGVRIHEYEFSIESLLPYLQERLLEFKLVPILVGEFRDAQGQVNTNTVNAVADVIRPLLTERTLLVVATSFTHYGGDYGYLPFETDVEDNIARLDRLAFESILALDYAGFRGYLERTRNVIDGYLCLQVLLKLLPAHAEARILAYDTSMAQTKEKQRSVSYAAFVFHNPDESALAPQPEKVRPLVLRRPERIVRPEAPASTEAEPPVSEGKEDKLP